MMALAGCAPHAELRATAPLRTNVEIAAAMPADTAAEPDTDGFSPTGAALFDVDRARELVAARRLRENVPSALSFRCVSGEESLGCAARPVTTVTEGESQ